MSDSDAVKLSMLFGIDVDEAEAFLADHDVDVEDIMDELHEYHKRQRRRFAELHMNKQ